MLLFPGAVHHRVPQTGGLKTTGVLSQFRRPGVRNQGAGRSTLPPRGESFLARRQAFLPASIFTWPFSLGVLLCDASPFLLILTPGERERHRCERETSVCCLPHVPRLGIETATQACALTRGRTHSLSLCRAMPREGLSFSEDTVIGFRVYPKSRMLSSEDP